MKPTVKSRMTKTADRGISLIELVAAMAIFALVAVMGTQALTGMIRLREDLATRSDRAADLAYSSSMLRADLSALVPMLFYPPGRAAPRSALSYETHDNRTTLALSLAGQPRFYTEFATPQTPETQAGALDQARIIWHLQDGVLSRDGWPVLAPARSDQRQAQVPVLTGVESLRLRSYWQNIGWVDGARPPTGTVPATAGTASAGDSDSSATSSEVYSSTLPLAVELALTTVHFGEIVLIQSLK